MFRKVHDGLIQKAAQRGRGTGIYWLLHYALCATFLFALPVPASVLSQPSISDETLAGFLYNIAKFIRWSGETPSQGEFVIAVIGSKNLEEVLARTLAGKTVTDRAIQIKEFKEGEAANLVYIAKEATPSQLSELSHRGIVTVGESLNFAEHGGTIAVSSKGQRIAFDINRRAARDAKVQIRSSVLSLAERIIE
jgi:hypothetical protein